MTDEQDPAGALVAAADVVANENDVDVLLINAGIHRGLDDRVIKSVVNRNRRTNVLLILVTEGGDPDTAYRIARVLQENYTTFTALVSGFCKSAGTLCILGANELAFGDFGELGPLDVQYAKKDDLEEFASGLVVQEALGKIQKEAFAVFERVMLSIMQRSQGQISFKLSSEIATKLTVGLFEPLSRQIDPVLLGDLERGMTIAKDYGERLRIKSKNFTPEVLVGLANSYSSHGFVIDKREAEQLFKNVRPCTKSEHALLDCLSELAVKPESPSEYVVEFISTENGVGTNESEIQVKGAEAGSKPVLGQREGSDAPHSDKSDGALEGDPPRGALKKGNGRAKPVSRQG